MSLLTYSWDLAWLWLASTYNCMGGLTCLKLGSDPERTWLKPTWVLAIFYDVRWSKTHVRLVIQPTGLSSCDYKGESTHYWLDCSNHIVKEAQRNELTNFEKSWLNVTYLLKWKFFLYNIWPKHWGKSLSHKLAKRRSTPHIISP